MMKAMRILQNDARLLWSAVMMGMLGWLVLSAGHTIRWPASGRICDQSAGTSRIAPTRTISEPLHLRREGLVAGSRTFADQAGWKRLDGGGLSNDASRWSGRR
jgi:hypothetical protein